MSASFAPIGLVLVDGFVGVDEERSLIQEIGELGFGEVRMHGVTARRRVVQFGRNYRFNDRLLLGGPDPPPFLLPLRARIAEVASVRPEEFAEILVTEYTPGAAIGWHRDAPPFGIVAGVSLGSACRFRLRRQVGDRWERATLDLLPRSLYILDGPARSEWQHSIPPVETLRYSLTFRTLRKAQTST